MYKLFIILIVIAFSLRCSNNFFSGDSKDTPREPKFTIDSKLGEAKYFKEFLLSIKSKDCVLLQNYLDDRVYFHVGENKKGTFERSNAYLESKYLFSVCNLFFETKTMRDRLSLIGETSLSNLHYFSPSDMLQTSQEIRFTYEKKGNIVGIEFIAGQANRPESLSKKLEFIFRCPKGIANPCFINSFSFQ